MSEDTGVWAYAITEDEHLAGPDGELVDLSWLDEVAREHHYVIDAAGSVTFTAAVAGQATAHPELQIELTGPWPPYSFAGPDDDEADDDGH